VIVEPEKNVLWGSGLAQASRSEDRRVCTLLPV
jgi:hypothetical protein